MIKEYKEYIISKIGEVISYAYAVNVNEKVYH